MPPAQLRAALDKLAAEPPAGRTGSVEGWRRLTAAICTSRQPAYRPPDRAAACMPEATAGPCGAGTAGSATMSRPVAHGSPDMIVLEGAPALSPFRRERLQARLQALHPDLRLLGAWPVYWVEPDAGACDARHRTRCAASCRPSRPRPPRAGRRGFALRHAAPGHAVALGQQGHRTAARRRPAGQARRARHPLRPRRLADRRRPPRRALAKVLHDPMTQSLLDARDDAAALFAVPARGDARAHPAGRPRERPTRASAWRWPTTRSTTCASATPSSAAIRPTSN